MNAVHDHVVTPEYVDRVRAAVNFMWPPWIPRQERQWDMAMEMAARLTNGTPLLQSGRHLGVEVADNLRLTIGRMLGRHGPGVPLAAVLAADVLGADPDGAAEALHRGRGGRFGALCQAVENPRFGIGHAMRFHRGHQNFGVVRELERLAQGAGSGYEPATGRMLR